MTLFQFFAIAGMPLLLFLIGFAGVKWIQWDLKRQDRLHPGE